MSEDAATPSYAEAFETLRVNADMVAERERITPYLDAAPDRTLAFVAEMNLESPETEGPVVYTCPMHPEIVQEEPGRCPLCGMALMAQAAPAVTYTCPMHPEIVSEAQGSCPLCGMKLLPSDLVSAAADDHGNHDMHAMHGEEPHADHAHHAIDHGDGHDMHEHDHHDMSQPEFSHDGHAHHDHATSAASSGKTTWSRSTASPRRRILAGSLSTATPALKTTASTGTSASATSSRSAWSTRWIRITQCTTRSTSMGPAGS